jgi:hypothetical protein
MLLQMLGQVGDTLGHAGNLVFGGASVLFVSSVLGTKFIHSFLRLSPGWWLAVVFYASIKIIIVFKVSDVYDVVLFRVIFIVHHRAGDWLESLAFFDKV